MTDAPERPLVDSDDSMFVPATVVAAVDIETRDVGSYRWDSLEAQATRRAASASYLFKLLAESLKPAP